MTANRLHLGTWVKSLRPVSAVLLPQLSEVFRTAKSAEQREYAATVLADYAAAQPELLADLLLDADSSALYDPLFQALKRSPEQAARRVRQELAIPMPDPNVPITLQAAIQRERLARRQATGAVTLLKLGQSDDAWPVFRHRPDPEARSQLIARVGRFKVDPKLLIQRWRRSRTCRPGGA